jgi:hypothetical protein
MHSNIANGIFHEKPFFSFPIHSKKNGYFTFCDYFSFMFRSFPMVFFLFMHMHSLVVALEILYFLE